MPQDKTPVGDAMTHRFPEQKIPQPKPGAREDRRIDRDVSDADITQPAAERNADERNADDERNARSER